MFGSWRAMRLRNGFQRYALAVQCAARLVERGHQGLPLTRRSPPARGSRWPQAARQAQKMATMSVHYLIRSITVPQNPVRLDGRGGVQL